MCRTKEIGKHFQRLHLYQTKIRTSLSYVFGLDLDAADQLCVLPVIKCQTVH